MFCDPKRVYIDRTNRQRQAPVIDETFKASIAKRIINPITVRPAGQEISLENFDFILVAGERRLTAALELGLAQVPYRLFSDLSETEAQIIELEENVKRLDLTWREQVRSLGKIHDIYMSMDQNWTRAKTAEAVSLTDAYLYKVFQVYNALDSNKLDSASGIENAYNILVKIAERKAEAVVNSIINQGAKLFGPEDQAQAQSQAKPQPEGQFSTSQTTQQGQTVVTIEAVEKLDLDRTTQPITPPPQPKSKPLDPIFCTNFIEWAKTYDGPKFNFIHCDFPYGTYKGDDSIGTYVVTEFYDNTPDVYWNLTQALVEAMPRLMSYSAHMLFWFDMKFYSESVRLLASAGLTVHPHPLIWHKTNSGVMPGNATTHPRRTYDTALLCVKGNRPFAKPGACSYAAPALANKMHPSQKPEPMLRFFFQMFVDENTVMLDPTCGSGSALKAAEDLGARSVLGLELDPTYAKEANASIHKARLLRSMGK